VRLDHVEAFVLDEADRMLDMGFVREVRRIAGMLPARRHTLLFSATMPEAVAEIAAALLRDPARVEVAPPATTVERVGQRVLFVEKEDKRALLEDILRDRAIERALVFTRTKHGANRVAQQLAKQGERADAIHGNKSQNARQRALEGFRSGEVRVLVATDIAARGIDVEGVTHVINFDLPNEPESYVHRIGRTARAGAEGLAISFCDAEETAYLRDIEKVIRQAVPVDTDHPYHAAHIASTVRHRGGPAPRSTRPAPRPQRPARQGTLPRGAAPARGGRRAPSL
jgi:ATP-dependent RNA helicase RhlE